MKTKRLFIATFIDFKMIERDYTLIRQEFSRHCEGKWVNGAKLHFTYKFLGDTNAATIPDIRQELKKILIDYDSGLTFNGLGCFPNTKKPRVLFVEIDDNKNILSEIHKEAESRLIKMGFQADQRNFKPHMTLLRIKTINEGFEQIFQKYKNHYFFESPTFSVRLVESKLTRTGPIYTIINADRQTGLS